MSATALAGIAGADEQRAERARLRWLDRPVGAGLGPPRPREPGDEHGTEDGCDAALGGRAAAPGGEAAEPPHGEPAKDHGRRYHGQRDAEQLEGIAGRIEELPVSGRLRDARGVLGHHRPRGAEQTRHGPDHGQEHQCHERDGDEHPQGDDRARPRRQDRVLGAVPAVRQQADEGRPDALIEIRDARQVGQDVVAVEAQQRQQLLPHLQHLRGDQQQQGLPAGRPPPHVGENDDDGVEVQPTQIGAQAAPAAESIAVGDVGVEGGPHDVEAGTHGSRVGAAVARSSGVSELVEAARDDRDDEHQQEQLRPLKGLVCRCAQATLEEDPRDDSDEPRNEHQRDERPEEARGTGPSAGESCVGW